MTAFLDFFRGLLRLGPRPDSHLAYLDAAIANARAKHLPVRDLLAAKQDYVHASLKAAVK